MKQIRIILALIPGVLVAASQSVRTPEALQKALSNAKPGDVIAITGKPWNDVRLELKARGTAKQPITVRSEISFTGTSSLELNGEHVVLDGFTFENGRLESGHVVRIRGSNNRITNSRIINYNPVNRNTRYHWLSLSGHSHRVDHCLFSGQKHSGVTLVVWLDDKGKVGHHLIERNHFCNRPRGNANGFETMRIGTSTYSMTHASCVVKDNLFENCDGEMEIISNKSCGNHYETNTFVGCAGTLTLRHGNNCIVRNNLILGASDRASGGIRIIGEDHQIIGNHIEGVGDRVGGAIAISAGVPNSKLNEYFQVRNLLIKDNTLINNAGKEIVYGHGKGSSGRTLMPKNVTVQNTKREGKPKVPRLTAVDVGPNASKAVVPPK